MTVLKKSFVVAVVGLYYRLDRFICTYSYLNKLEYLYSKFAIDNTNTDEYSIFSMYILPYSDSCILH